MIELLAPAVLLGLVGSAHCIGMCGPLALAIPSIGEGWAGRLGGAALLNGGRVVTYVLFGFLFGAFGRGLQLAGIQQAVSISLGVMILLGVAVPALLRTGKLAQIPARLVMRLQGTMAKQLKRTSPGGLFLTGMLNGLLPCGLVYLALAGALAYGGWQEGGLFMLLFGLGTWPALIAVRLGGHGLTPAWRSGLRKLAPYVMGLMAMLLIIRGLGLDIPYLSPALYPPIAPEACP